jgi:putative ABC transport system ATP-binding protein
LDLQSGLAVIALLRDLAHERGRAVVLVTHDSRILQFADRIVRIEDGRIVPRSEIDEPALVVPGRPRTEAGVGVPLPALAIDSR